MKNPSNPTPDHNSSIFLILEKYWGYKNFRPLQEDVIQSVLDGHDTLALLPTGGGKSICFQVPAIQRKGICIVITPLIALMKDQVENLKKRGINATAIYSGMMKREIDITLDNCVYGNVKFLYCSPERLKTEIFIERVKKMKVGLLAIDEAHCISQWGYDFRPPYLEIASFRTLIPDVPCIALTATATEKVCEDIQENLAFKTKVLFRKSFARDNLSYSVFHVENKEAKLLRIINSVAGSSVVYCRTRNHTKRVAEFLQKQLVSADYYHAGLDVETRSKKQHDWISGKLRVIVATNAFGMGIDKPDVRSVVHMDMPDSPEAYYQEAGRAGRDEKKAYAVLLYNLNDLNELRERISLSHPDVKTIRQAYQALANYYQLATDSGFMQEFAFDIAAFCKQYNLEPEKTHYAIKKLEGQGLIQVNESFFTPSKLFFSTNHQDLYAFQVANRDVDDIIKLLLRLYGAELFDHFIRISERDIARKADVKIKEVYDVLAKLAERGVAEYVPQSDIPKITFLTPRKNATDLKLDTGLLQRQKAEALKKVKTMSHYVKEEHQCRTLMLLAYFDEISDEECGVCDFCIEKRKRKSSSDSFHQIRTKIMELLIDHPINMADLPTIVTGYAEKEIASAVTQMLDMNEIKLDEKQNLHLS